MPSCPYPTCGKYLQDQTGLARHLSTVHALDSPPPRRSTSPSPEPPINARDHNEGSYVDEIMWDGVEERQSGNWIDYGSDSGAETGSDDEREEEESGEESDEADEPQVERLAGDGGRLEKPLEYGIEVQEWAGWPHNEHGEPLHPATPPPAPDYLADPKRPFFPFESQRQFDWAKHYVRYQYTKEQFMEHTNLLKAEDIKPPFKSRDKLYELVAQIPYGQSWINWKCATFQLSPPDGETDPKIRSLYLKRYKCYFRNTAEVFSALCSHPAMQGHQYYQPIRINLPDGSFFISENFTSVEAWERQAELPKGHHHVDIQLGSDSTALSAGTGNAAMHLVYMTIASNPAFSKRENQGVLIPIGVIPIPKNPDGKRNEEWHRRHARRVRHHAMALIIEPLKGKILSPNGSLERWADGFYRWSHPQIGSHVLDTPEASWSSCMLAGWCPTCDMEPAKLGVGPGQPRSALQSEQLRQEGAKVARVHGLHMERPYTTQVGADIHKCIRGDLLHQNIKAGVKDHGLGKLLFPLFEVLGGGKAGRAEFNRKLSLRLACMPHYADVRRFKDPLDNVGQWTNESSIALMKLIRETYAEVPAAGDDDDEESGFSWVRLHAWFHYVTWTVQSGVLDLSTTAYYETAHKVPKAGYRSSNHCDYEEWILQYMSRLAALDIMQTHLEAASIVPHHSPIDTPVYCDPVIMLPKSKARGTRACRMSALEERLDLSGLLAKTRSYLFKLTGDPDSRDFNPMTEQFNTLTAEFPVYPPPPYLSPDTCRTLSQTIWCHRNYPMRGCGQRGRHWARFDTVLISKSTGAGDIGLAQYSVARPVLFYSFTYRTRKLDLCLAETFETIDGGKLHSSLLEPIVRRQTTPTGDARLEVFDVANIYRSVFLRPLWDYDKEPDPKTLTHLNILDDWHGKWVVSTLTDQNVFGRLYKGIERN
ncbi:hypothetical protein P7C70_g808, partial [Phenoliferia sp. Uapishka_3]